MPPSESLIFPEDMVSSPEMDLSDSESNLHALQKLYGLLKDDGDASTSNKLDDKARNMLKMLLDMATEKVIKAHPKTVGRQVGKSFSSQQLREEDGQKFPLQCNLPKAEYLSGLTSPLKEERGLGYRPSQAVNSCQSNTMNFTASASGNRNKRCRICNRSTVRLSKTTSLYSDQGAQNPKSVNSLPRSPFIRGEERSKGLTSSIQSSGSVGHMKKSRQGGEDDTSCSLNRAEPAAFPKNQPTSSAVISESPPNPSAEAVENIKEAASLASKAALMSKEASEAISEIQSNISALILDSDSSGPPRKRAGRCGLPIVSTTVSPVTDSDLFLRLIKDGAVTDTDFSSNETRVTAGNELLLEAVNQNKTLLVNNVPTKSVSRSMDPKLPNLRVNQSSKPLPPTNTMMGMNESGKIGRNSARIAGCNTSSFPGKSDREEILQNENLMLVSGKNMKGTINEFETPCKRAVADDCMMSTIKSFRFPEWDSNRSVRATITPGEFERPNKGNQGQNRVDLNERSKTTKVDSAQKLYPRRMEHKRKFSRVDSLKLPVMLEHRPIQAPVSSALRGNLLDQHKVENFSKNNPFRRMRKDPDDQDESTDSNHSARTNQIISTSSNETELYSESGEIQTSLSPGSNSESEEYSLPRLSRRVYASATGSESDEVYSSASDTDNNSFTSSSGTYQDTPASSSESSMYSPDARPGSPRYKEESYSADDSDFSNSSRARVHTSKTRNSSKKKSGRLKKLKDKLAIIFHHHHHHHHHLHHSDENDQINHPEKKTRGKSLWKHSKKINYPKRERETKGEQAVEKLGKSVMRGGRPQKNQHKHFHELVKGLFRHMRRSKKSKAATKLPRTHHGSKKPPWWNLLQNQRGVKLHKKKHMLR